MKKKECYKCHHVKNSTDFSRDQKRKDSLSPECKTCRADRERASYWNNPERTKKRKLQNKKRTAKRTLANRQFLYNYLLKHPCIDCGEKDPVVLEFDHRSDKIGNVSQLVKTSNLEGLQLEISKCDVRCANCHRRKTAKDFNWYFDLEKEKQIET